jgi:hypothetical protein
MKIKVSRALSKIQQITATMGGKWIYTGEGTWWEENTGLFIARTGTCWGDQGCGQGIHIQYFLYGAGTPRRVVFMGKRIEEESP